jgi:hypothetical protein
VLRQAVYKWGAELCNLGTSLKTFCHLAIPGKRNLPVTDFGKTRQGLKMTVCDGFLNFEI